MIILSVLGIIAVVFFGFLFIDALLPDENILARMSLGYPFGIGAFTFVLYILNLLGIPYRVGDTSLVLLVLVIFSFLINLFSKRLRKRKLFEYNLKVKMEFRKLGLVEKIIFGCIFLLFVSSFINSVYWPVTTWDSLVLYDFRAKSFLATGFMSDAISRGYFFSYPLLTSLAHMWGYMLGFKTPVFLYSIFYISLITFFYFSIRKFGGRTLSALFTLLLAINLVIFQHSQIAYTNLPYLAYFTPASALLVLATRAKNKLPLLFISAVFFGLSTWTRSGEPFWLIGVVMGIVVSIVSKKYFGVVFFSLFVAMFYYPWKIQEYTYGGAGNELISSAPSLVSALVNNMEWSRVKDVSIYFWKYVVLSYSSLLLALFATVPFFIAYKNKLVKKVAVILGIIVGILAFIFAGTYIFSVSLVNWRDIGDSSRRASLILVPLILLYLALFFSGFVKIVKGRRIRGYQNPKNG